MENPKKFPVFSQREYEELLALQGDEFIRAVKLWLAGFDESSYLLAKLKLRNVYPKDKQTLAEQVRDLPKSEARRIVSINREKERARIFTKIRELKSDREMKRLDKLVAIRDLKKELRNV